MSLYRSPTANFWSTTLNGAINDSATTITLNSTTNLQAPGFLVIDREDGNGTATASAREVVSFTGISGSDITGVTRADDNSTARSHNDGALVESVFAAGVWEDLQTNLMTGNATVAGVLDVQSALISQASIGALGMAKTLTSTGAVDITIGDTINDVPLTIIQNDVTNNPEGANILNAGTGAGLILDQNGNGVALSIDSEATSSYGAEINVAAANDQAFIRFKADSAATAFFEVKRNDDLNEDVTILIGSYHIWVDTNGDLRIKNGNPTSDTDGTIVGTQS